MTDPFHADASPVRGQAGASANGETGQAAAGNDLPTHPGAADIPYDLIELFFFAYRDFVSDPDRILEKYGFGRAHHRVLHFVNRRPGLTIAALLDILKITKQSLNRVLKELIEQGYIDSRAGESDRRQRLLFPTETGRQLAHDLALLQARRINRAFADKAGDARQLTKDVLLSMINPDDRESATGPAPVAARPRLTPLT
jgi:DNA-binding MarR family transcriptional regulator